MARTLSQCTMDQVTRMKVLNILQFYLAITLLLKLKKKKKDQCMPWVEEGKRKGGMIDGVWMTFWAMDIVVLIQSWWIHKPVERTAPSVDPEVKCGLWVTTACQCGLICYKCATLLGDVDVG